MKSGTQPGHVVGASFGLVFVILNTQRLGTPGRPIAVALAVVAMAIVLASFVRTLRQGKPERPENQSARGYFVIVALEVVALFGGLAVINKVEPSAVTPWIALVVGLHFVAFSIWWLRGQREMLAIGLLMVALAVVGGVLVLTQDDRSLVALVSGFGSGVVLLGSSVLSVFRTQPDQRATSAAAGGTLRVP
ncbi:hypothetical protein [Kribbella sp. NPDC023855]|uniref:hypothetical protein n=1 Tax=Kribbella sp. NPDC023855 TaxID=3154698 RepID=UPI0034023268